MSEGTNRPRLLWAYCILSREPHHRAQEGKAINNIMSLHSMHSSLFSRLFRRGHSGSRCHPLGDTLGHFIFKRTLHPWIVTGSLGIQEKVRKIGQASCLKAGQRQAWSNQIAQEHASKEKQSLRSRGFDRNEATWTCAVASVRRETFPLEVVFQWPRSV